MIHILTPSTLTYYPKLMRPFLFKRKLVKNIVNKQHMSLEVNYNEDFQDTFSAGL